MGAKFPSIISYLLEKNTTLPAWVPQRLIAMDLGLSLAGIEKAQASLDGKPYLTRLGPERTGRTDNEEKQGTRRKRDTNMRKRSRVCQ